ncbi:hypothetical protein [Nocardia sp. NBC_01009]|uniref:hypothetical protein n=1 Tax=Nocardia sp. NBC_01009 TaxID=2975996 RepID=UPI0038682854|nr:hypothetical protein OHA42_17740 [Nocardia sp. NBC_01009]
MGDAGAADALPAKGFVDPDDAMAARACRSDDPGDASSVEGFDQREDRADRSEMPSAGEQFGLRFQRPTDPALV